MKIIRTLVLVLSLTSRFSMAQTLCHHQPHPSKPLAADGVRVKPMFSGQCGRRSLVVLRNPVGTYARGYQREDDTVRRYSLQCDCSTGYPCPNCDNKSTKLDRILSPAF